MILVPTAIIMPTMVLATSAQLAAAVAGAGISPAGLLSPVPLLPGSFFGCTLRRNPRCLLRGHQGVEAPGGDAKWLGLRVWGGLVSGVRVCKQLRRAASEVIESPHIHVVEKIKDRLPLLVAELNT